MALMLIAAMEEEYGKRLDDFNVPDRPKGLGR